MTERKVPDPTDLAVAIKEHLRKHYRRTTPRADESFKDPNMVATAAERTTDAVMRAVLEHTGYPWDHRKCCEILTEWASHSRVMEWQPYVEYRGSGGPQNEGWNHHWWSHPPE